MKYTCDQCYYISNCKNYDDVPLWYPCVLCTYKAKEEENVRMEVDIHLETTGKTFLHLAVEHKAPKIVQFLLFENEDDPNVLTHNT